MRHAVAFTLVVVLAGCGTMSMQTHHRLYDGPRLPSDKVAVVRGAFPALLFTVDGKPGKNEIPVSATSQVKAYNAFNNLSGAPGNFEIELMPGKHTLECGFAQNSFFTAKVSTTMRIIEFEAKEGQTYHVRATPNASPDNVEAFTVELVTYGASQPASTSPLAAVASEQQPPSFTAAAPPQPVPPASPSSEVKSSQSSDLTWSEDVLKKVNKATGEAANDPVSAFFDLKSLLDQKEPPLSSSQKAWLEENTATLQPRALEALRNDMAAAIQANDLRALFLVMFVGNQVQENALNDNGKLVLEKSTLFSGTHAGPSTFEVTSVSATPIAGSYQADVAGSDKTLTMSANPGYQLLKVDVSVKNVSSGIDKAYLIHAFGMKSIFATPKPEGGRWYDEDTIFLVTPGGESISSSYTLSGFSLTLTIEPKDGGIKHMCAPEHLLCGETITASYLFSVPAGIQGLRLWVLGAPLAPLNHIG